MSTTDVAFVDNTYGKKKRKEFCNDAGFLKAHTIISIQFMHMSGLNGQSTEWTNIIKFRLRYLSSDYLPMNFISFFFFLL